ncbi:ribosome small subunit-dependent GTPase A [Planctomycetota bacterium]
MAEDQNSQDESKEDEVLFDKIRPPEKEKTRPEPSRNLYREDVSHDADKLSEAVIVEVQPKGCFAHTFDADGLRSDTRIWLSVRKSLKGKKQKAKNIIAVGDRVLFEPQDGDEGVVEVVKDRKTKLSRPATRGQDRIEHVLVANADQLAVVSAVRQPELRPGLVDRYLVAARHNNMTGMVVINKIDLDPGVEVATYAAIYERAGCQVFCTNALTGQGVPRLRAAIEGRTTVFCGHSGVGKSALLNIIVPGANIKVGEVPEKYMKGRHTTNNAVLYHIEGNTRVIDTPGVREFGLWGVNKEDIDNYYPEIRDLKHNCRFSTCGHDKEPDCAVTAALAAGEIHPERMASYRRIKETLGRDYS